MTQTSNIETNRLVLRPFTESDAPDVFESCKNPNLGNNAGWKTRHWLHWHHSRSKAGESACPHAGILAG